MEKLEALQKELDSINEGYKALMEKKDALMDERNEIARELIDNGSAVTTSGHTFSQVRVPAIDLVAMKAWFGAEYTRLVTEHPVALSISVSDFKKALEAMDLPVDKIVEAVSYTKTIKITAKKRTE